MRFFHAGQRDMSTPITDFSWVDNDAALAIISSVVGQAVVDYLFGPDNSEMSARQRSDTTWRSAFMDDAQEWLFSDDQGVMSFCWACHGLGIDIGAARKEISRQKAEVMATGVTKYSTRWHKR